MSDVSLLPKLVYLIKFHFPEACDIGDGRGFHNGHFKLQITYYFACILSKCLSMLPLQGLRSHSCLIALAVLSFFLRLVPDEAGVLINSGPLLQSLSHNGNSPDILRCLLFWLDVLLRCNYERPLLSCTAVLYVIPCPLA